MAKRFRGRYTEAEIDLFRTGEYTVPYLVAEGYSQDELVGEMMNISNSMGLKAELNDITEKTGILHGTAPFFMLGILRRFLALEKLRKS